MTALTPAEKMREVRRRKKALDVVRVQVHLPTALANALQVEATARGQSSREHLIGQILADWHVRRGAPDEQGE